MQEKAIRILINGQRAREFTHNGINFVVMPDEPTEYQIELVGNAAGRTQAVVSVDGRNIIDGKSASATAGQGYVLERGQVARIPGWMVDGQNAAAFSTSSASGSYSAQMSGGDTRNVGVIGLVLYAERYGMSYPQGGYDPGDLGNLRGGGNTRSASENAPRGGITRSADIGTGFGARKDFATTTTNFERGQELCRETLHYRTRSWFIANNIPIPFDARELPSAFPADTSTGCRPPDGWRG